MPAPSSSSARLPAALAEWITSLGSTVPVLSEIDDDTGKPKRAVKSLVVDLNDGVVLGQIVANIDSDYFRGVSSASNAANLATNWVLRFNQLKRLYKLIIRYFEDTLKTSTASLPAPNLQLIAKADGGAEGEMAILAGLVLALAVRSNQAEVHVEKIRGFDEWAQKELMMVIEQVNSKLVSKESTASEDEDDPDTEFYNHQHDKSRLLTDKEALQLMYDDLAKSYQSLKDDHDEALGSLASADARVEEALATAKAAKQDRAESAFKAEMDKMTKQLDKTENELAECQGALDKQTRLNEDLARKVDELAPRAQQAGKLKDELDEYRHGADKVKKMENVVEKYKKKLEDQATVKRQLKALEEENAGLLDKHAELEDEYRAVSAFKPLLDQYKAQLDAHEAKAAALTKEGDKLRHALGRAEDRVAVLVEEQERDRESLGLFEERVREMELGATPGRRKPRQSTASAIDGAFDTELDAAEEGTTMTDLKLKVRKLERELAAAPANKADGSRVVVLENLLEDANRMKARYEKDYLAEHRDKIVIQSKLDQIVAGKSSHGDGPEAAIAIRMRLNETVEELERLKKQFAKIDVKAEQLERELTVAKSDLNLVNKDQLEILGSLRASVSVEKAALSQQVDSIKVQLSEAELKHQMQLSQINTLLMDKANLQTDSIEQREKAIQREKDVGDLRASTGSGRALGEAEQAKLASLEEAHTAQQAEVAKLRDRLAKAKKFIQEQDELFKRQHEEDHHSSLEEAEQSARSQIAHLTEELERQKVNTAEVEARYRREQQLMLVAWHDLSMRVMREGVANAPANAARAGAGNASWLSQQRAKTKGAGLRHA